MLAERLTALAKRHNTVLAKRPRAATRELRSLQRHGACDVGDVPGPPNSAHSCPSLAGITTARPLRYHTGETSATQRDPHPRRGRLPTAASSLVMHPFVRLCVGHCGLFHEI